MIYERVGLGLTGRLRPARGTVSVTPAPAVGLSRTAAAQAAAGAMPVIIRVLESLASSLACPGPAQ